MPNALNGAAQNVGGLSRFSFRESIDNFASFFALAASSSHSYNEEVAAIVFKRLALTISAPSTWAASGGEACCCERGSERDVHSELGSMVQRRKTKSHHFDCTLVRGLDCDTHVAQSAVASDTMALASTYSCHGAFCSKGSWFLRIGWTSLHPLSPPPGDAEMRCAKEPDLDLSGDLSQQ